MTIFLTLLIGRPNCNCIIYFESIFGLKLNHQNAIQYSKKKNKKKKRQFSGTRNTTEIYAFINQPCLYQKIYY